LGGLPVYCDESGDFLGYRGTASDITELRTREDALRLAKETAELANRTKSEFLASMSHELRTPLNAIIGFSEIMSNEMLGPIGTPQYKGYLDDITDSAKHLLVVINDILDVAKIESGHVALSEEAVDPAVLAESVVRLITPRSEEANITLALDMPENPPTLHGDKTKLKQILINLLSNAVKFTPEGGRIELRARIAEDGGFLFVVRDTGIGMSKDDIRVALTPFGQVDSRLSRRFEGTGLGLPLAQGLTEMHGGAFEIESTPGQGTTVTVRLPAERVLGS
jgi:signal transduction histidine kinase